MLLRSWVPLRAALNTTRKPCARTVSLGGFTRGKCAATAALAPRVVPAPAVQQVMRRAASSEATSIDAPAAPYIGKIVDVMHRLCRHQCKLLRHLVVSSRVPGDLFKLPW
eukprot:SAG11_NODE_4109_length_2061_cov_1.398063_1_plen_110_part_00